MGKNILNKIDTRAPKEYDKQQTKDKLVKIIEDLNEMQNLLYAENKHAILIVIQGMDASGKDGAIKNVFGTMNPQGVRVKSYKAPSEEELAHDFLWRIHKETPARGMIQVFNRSQYEDILITRVHGWCDDEKAKKRMDAINNFEKLLKQNDTIVLKFYLHISQQEQQQRLQERQTDPTKMWKFNPNDLEEAKKWDQYMDMYEDCFENCNDPQWTIVPSDQNWFKEYTIAKALRDSLRDLNMQYPGIKS